MDFNELKRVCETNHIPTTKLAVDIGLTYGGLKSAMINRSLAMRYIVPICEALCISPNKFLGYKEAAVATQTQNGCYGSAQYMDTQSIKVLHDQLKEKDRQIAEKDTQIQNLISLLAK